jgi:hypothetical protein
MAVIQPSINFEGSDIGKTYNPIPYVREEVKKAIFSKKSNPDGANVYFLPAYKQDRNGAGVWFKKINIRDNFGTKYKEKYFVPNTESDPAGYFARNFRILYPEDAKTVDVEMNGHKFKKYPDCGKAAERVLFNVAFHQNMSAGAHLLDLPLHNGADKLLKHLQSLDINGNPRKPINDPNRCIPFMIRMTTGTASPWSLDPDTDHPARLPLALSDSQNLINLDNILIIKDNEEIISKLRDMYSPEVFDNCMNGFPGLIKRAVQGASMSQPKPKAQPVQYVEEVVNEPEVFEFPEEMQVEKPFSAPSSQAHTQTQDVFTNDEYEEEESLTPVAPVVRKPVLRAPVGPVNAPPAAGVSTPNQGPAGRLSKEEAMNWLNQD